MNAKNAINSESKYMLKACETGLNLTKAQMKSIYGTHAALRRAYRAGSMEGIRSQMELVAFAVATSQIVLVDMDILILNIQTVVLQFLHVEIVWLMLVKHVIL
jgi:hypothetical protein